MTKEQNDYVISDTMVRRSQQQQFKNQISWSRQGHIAYSPPITDQGNLCITYMECLDGKTWQLAPPTTFTIQSFDEFPNEKSEFTLLSFSNTGWDLFTADANGHVTILVTGIKKVYFDDIPQPYTNHSNGVNGLSQSPANAVMNSVPTTQYTRTSFNSLEIFYSDNTQLPFPNLTDQHKKYLNQVLAMKWLNIDKQVIANAPAVRSQVTPENQVLNGCAAKLGAASQDASGFFYTYSAHQYKPYGAMHPLKECQQSCLSIIRMMKLSIPQLVSREMVRSLLLHILQLQDL
ncbi:unnamed protein product [Ambrosiozyma monospora]|uniref:Unnamed protein product n=1 Tax=Ambrosiozyma monospora TaxID=43982 RepID=A0ACB5TIB3_AMBMO|nr:unnamed protein product [Ambrosiozyma monospora]